MYDQDRNQESFAPVKVGDEIDVKIEAVGEKGDGIAKQEGFVLFVPNTKEGQEVKIRITKVLRKVGFAEQYFWGAEWWYWMKEVQNDPAMWNEAKKVFSGSDSSL